MNNKLLNDKYFLLSILIESPFVDKKLINKLKNTDVKMYIKQVAYTRNFIIYEIYSSLQKYSHVSLYEKDLEQYISIYRKNKLMNILNN